MYYFFKKALSAFFFPMPLCIGVSFLGLYLIWRTGNQKTGKILVSASVLSLYLLSSGPVSHILLEPLEKQYSFDQSEKTVNFIIVLGGGYISNPRLPVTSQLNAFSLSRLQEGVRLHRENPGSRLVFTGEGCSGGMARVAKAIGVNKKYIIVESKSEDTKDEAINSKKIVGNAEFILVTSASHMPRAMALFRKQGLNPIPFPTGHLLRGNQKVSLSLLLPSSHALYRSERAFHEYMGLLWARLRGQI